MTDTRPLVPVKPTSMELIFVYVCPFCRRELPVISPEQPSLVPCDACGRKFPIIPVDQRTVHYVKIMLGNGAAAVDPDFV